MCRQDSWKVVQFLEDREYLCNKTVTCDIASIASCPYTWYAYSIWLTASRSQAILNLVQRKNYKERWQPKQQEPWPLDESGEQPKHFNIYAAYPCRKTPELPWPWKKLSPAWLYESMYIPFPLRLTNHIQLHFFADGLVASAWFQIL